jgi:pimeloyl-ACP methyl ester carboxylesterase
VYVSIGGIDQWVQVGGADSANPILLYLHGGPGGTSVPASAAWRPWESHFNVVHWDQRGASRTFKRNGEDGCGPLSLGRIVADGLELTQYLLSTLRLPKVLLVGHSWGSAVGVHMVKRQPALFSAFVGTGQLVNMRRNEQVNYQRYLEQAERRGDAQALRALRDLGPPPFTRPDGLKIVREWADRLADGDGDALQPRPMPMSLDFGRDDVPSLLQGMDYSRRALSGDLLGIDLTSLGLAFEVPMFCFHGACDQHTPVELAEQYFERISAPHKEFVRFDGCHHFVAINRPELFLQQLLARVQPWLEASS